MAHEHHHTVVPTNFQNDYQKQAAAYNAQIANSSRFQVGLLANS